MKKIINTRFIALALIALMAVIVATAQIPPRPKTADDLVYDYAHVIDTTDYKVIRDSLRNLYMYNKTQVVVLTVESLDGMEIEDFCQQVFQEWGIGDKETNNGVLIVIKPKTEASRGQVRIHTGYGAEGALPDLLCKKIETDSMIPAFKENNYGLAVCKAVSLIVPSMKGEYPSDIATFLKEKEAEKERNSLIAVIVYVILYVLLCGLIWYFFFMPTNSDWYSIMASPLIAATITPSSSRRSSGSGSSWSSGSSGSSWSSSSSSSSSSGGWSWGGGSSGGGGASSSW
ncbi:MAG: TPM domain-containing protein [Muribaculaceae bacterium]|nr:TPM domain-containing protein [Muribaculaceae bacterium]